MLYDLRDKERKQGGVMDSDLTPGEIAIADAILLIIFVVIILTT